MQMPEKQQKECIMKFKQLMSAVAFVGAISFGATSASATQDAYDINLKAVYPNTTVSCFICHTGTPGSMRPYGNAYTAAGGAKSGTTAAIQTIDTQDADSDSITNGAEILANTDPNPASTAGGGGGGCITDAATTPLMMVLAMLTLGFFVRRKKD